MRCTQNCTLVPTVDTYPPVDFSDLLRSIVQQVPEEATAIGFVPREDAGQVLAVKPKGQYQGVSATSRCLRKTRLPRRG